MQLNGKSIKPAFELAGKKYFMYDNVFDMATGRGLAAAFIYDEYMMKCDYGYLKIHCEVVDKIFQINPKNPKMDLGLLMQIHANLKERLNIAAMPEYLYKLASVFYWDETEDPYLYDAAYNERKIAEWKTNPEALGFFLTGPLSGFLPFASIQNQDLNTFLKVAGLKDQLSRKFLSEALSKVE